MDRKVPVALLIEAQRELAELRVVDRQGGRRGSERFTRCGLFEECALFASVRVRVGFVFALVREAGRAGWYLLFIQHYVARWHHTQPPGRRGRRSRSHVPKRLGAGGFGCFLGSA